jgi:putative MATE family efflux protein
MEVSIIEKAKKDDSDFVTSGSTWGAIWHISWPLVLNMGTIGFASFADIYVAGRLSSEIQAAVGIDGQIWYLIMLLSIALSAATTALVSRFWGAGDHAQAIAAARYSLIFALLFGVVATAVGFIGAKPLLQVLGIQKDVADLTWEYLRVELFAQVPWNLVWVCNAISRARGNTRVPLFTCICMTVVIVALDCLLCLHPFHLGITGLALSSFISSLVGSTLTLGWLRQSDLAECLILRERIDLKELIAWCKRFFNIGFPACVQDVGWLLGNFFFLLIFARTPHPEACLSAWTVGVRVEELFVGFPIYALALAIGTIVGQNLGADKPDRAERAGWQITLVGAGANAVFGLLMFFGAEQIANAMISRDPLSVDYTAQYFRIVGLSEPFLAAWLILFGAMQGAGYTKWTMWANIVCMILLRLPLAWILTLNLGIVPQGTWWAISGASMVIGLLAILHFKEGKWKMQIV